ncbi:ABC transporter permease [Algoriphagus marincola]|uniref:ABC transporter permease n=1 Tax=Algoriphagus marincola TaxID=264027 RepID=UPI0003FF0B0D|nr:ABC transporter permease [Algoriphagus marincola]
MSRNYLKIAIRNILNRKLNSLIHLFGLSLGIFSTVILGLVIHYEISHDKFHPGFEKMFRVWTKDTYSDGEENNPGINPAFANQLMAEDELFEHIVPILSIYGPRLTVDNSESSSEENYYEVDRGFVINDDYPNLFYFDLISGNPNSLKSPNQVFLTRDIAVQLFGSVGDAINQQLKVNEQLMLTIAGVVENSPINSNFRPEIYISFETIRANPSEFQIDFEEWGSTGSNFQLFVSPKKDIELSYLEDRLSQLSIKHFENRGNSIKSHHLQNFSEIHYDIEKQSFTGTVVQKSEISTLIIITFLIILVVSINYVNLSISQVLSRGKEIGVHRILGGSQFQISKLSFFETLTLLIPAGLLATLFVYLVKPYLHQFSNIPQEYKEFPPSFYLYILFVLILIGVLSGFYPALVLSKFNPIKTLKSNLNTSQLGYLSFRKVLISVQFVITQFLMIAALITILQMDHINNADLGFNEEQVLVFGLGNSENRDQTLPTFKQELMRIPGVRSVSFSSDTPASMSNSSINFAFDFSTEYLPYPVFVKYGDHDFFESYEIDFLYGSGYIPGDTSQKAILNETLALQLSGGKPEEIIGKTIKLGGGNWLDIAGVVKDFTPNSLKDPMKPLLITSNSSRYSRASIRLENTAGKETIDQIESVFKLFFDSSIFNAEYYDETIDRFYESEEKLALIYKIFTGISVLLSALGLYGLISFISKQRVKEIGIRKTLGASTNEIVMMISKEFLLIVVLSFFVAAPIAYSRMSDWLDDFASRIDLSIGIFIGVFLVSLFLTSLTVGFKAFKAALANPVKSIQSE